ncbi:PilZ domain protein [Paraliobacillus sp. PM-2]|uniref:PilZ domain-containing protein n=1 Tax=Paraliobacillus sp. PM-2 TaxID=1462524 RepID=UPI00061CB510|nr:PilZ domain-containing protein [Paraliobacillus sp. PM-2]CQR47220.1 PilZ domain protein [Paraliobacillus sp. PM-2]
MRYRRQESLRYQFPKPINGTFVILIDNIEQDKLHRSDAGNLQIIDLSPGGMKIGTDLDLPLDKKNYLLEISFMLGQEKVKMTGTIVWKKKRISGYYYGIEGLESEEKEQEIIDILKKLHLNEKKEEDS